MSKVKFAAAKELIQKGEYDAARAVLKTIEHPMAQKWLAKLDEMTPETPPVPIEQTGAILEEEKGGYHWWVYIFVIVGLFTFAGSLIMLLVMYFRPNLIQQPEMSLLLMGIMIAPISITLLIFPLWIAWVLIKNKDRAWNWQLRADKLNRAWGFGGHLNRKRTKRWEQMATISGVVIIIMELILIGMWILSFSFIIEGPMGMIRRGWRP